MNLFAASNVDLPSARKGGPPVRLAMRTLRVPLLNHGVVEDALQRAAFSPTDEQRKTAADYAKIAGSAKFLAFKETTVRDRFYADILVTLLGYERPHPDQPYTLAVERSIRRGAVDAALGRFPGPDGSDELIAPCEMKGPDTRDLDAVMPGRGRSPVQQAWDYAIDSPGARWVLVSNCIELRLYAFGSGRDAYELFDLRRLGEEDEHRRLWLLLSAGRFLGGDTDRLLARTAEATKQITNALYVEYRGLRDRLIQYLVDSADGPKLAPLGAIELAQKLLDRVLFIAFAQRTDLLPDKLLKGASEAQNDFNPVLLWTNFKNLFRWLDIGNLKPIEIEAYNGGLFAPDPAADALMLPDELTKELALLGGWDYRSDVPVTVLGHIFEHSITDLEARRAEARGEPAPAVSKRKRNDVVYTPDLVTRFLVERTLGRTLAEWFSSLLQTHAGVAEPPERGEIPWREAGSETAFWQDYVSALRGLTVVDPACGSGAFLVAAFDALAADYRRASLRLAELDAPIDFDPFDEIVTRNLYGVDLNAESVEITRLSLWLKTARRKHKLQNLEATIKVGDSLVDDASFTARPFDWRAAFPQVFAAGGFDVVIGNPPYVRMELIKPIKPYLERHYVVAADRADLYAYFFERGVGLLKEGGRLGYISSSTFFRTGSGENLRTFLGDRGAIEAVVDFGDLQLFEGVTTYPAILTLRKAAGEGGTLSFLKVDALPKDLEILFEENATPVPQARLGRGSWRFEDDLLALLRAKISNGRKTLGELYGVPMRGIVTGLNEAFVIDQSTHDRLVALDPKSADLIKPFLRGENLKRWRIEPEGLFLINTPKGKVDINAYPAVRDWLLPFKPALEKRATKQEWFELQQAQLAYQSEFSRAKVVYRDISAGPNFSLDTNGTFLDSTMFMLRSQAPAIVAFLNSRVAWFQWLGETPIARGGYLRLKEQYVSPTFVPSESEFGRTQLTELATVCALSAQARFEIIKSVRRRILDLASMNPATLQSQKLEAWHALQFSAFRTEIQRVFKADIPVKERGGWESYLADNAAEVARLTGEIEAAEREIDAIVYRLFDLDAAEIALLEASLAGQY